jgi:hypothetical protein
MVHSCHILSLAIQFSPNNGPVDMISSEKLIYYVPTIHSTCSIMYIGPLVAKLQLHYTLVVVGSSVAPCRMTLGVYVFPP